MPDNDSKVGRPRAINPDDLLSQMHESPQPVWTARQIAERNGITRKTAHKYLKQLAAGGDILTIQLGGVTAYYHPSLVEAGEERRFHPENSMEDYRRYAALLDDVEDAYSELFNTLAGGVPVTVQNPGLEKIDDGLMQLRSDLENRMAAEHPEEWSTDVFYGESNNDPEI